jgi:hypothetical protein
MAQVVPMAVSGVLPGTRGGEERIHSLAYPLALAAQRTDPGGVLSFAGVATLR